MNQGQQSISGYDQKDLLRAFSAINDLLTKAEQTINQNNINPFPESIAANEINSFLDKTLIQDAHYRGMMSLESAADHLWAFVDLYKEPAKSIAPLTCARASLESSALTVWLLDPEIDAKTRVKRCFSIRYEDLNQQLKIANVDNDQQSIQLIRQRINYVAKEAALLGFMPITNKEKTTGIGQRFPGFSELIKITLDQEINYRILSAIAHGDHTALSQASFRPSDPGEIAGPYIKAYKKTIDPNIVFPFAYLSMVSFAKVLWYQVRLYGSGQLAIEEFMDQLFDRLFKSKKFRFWHSA